MIKFICLFVCFFLVGSGQSQVLSDVQVEGYDNMGRYSLWAHTTFKLRNVSPEQCADKCNRMGSYKCNSFEYNINHLACFGRKQGRDKILRDTTSKRFKLHSDENYILFSKVPDVPEVNRDYNRERPERVRPEPTEVPSVRSFLRGQPNRYVASTRRDFNVERRPTTTERTTTESTTTTTTPRTPWYFRRTRPTTTTTERTTTTPRTTPYRRRTRPQTTTTQRTPWYQRRTRPRTTTTTPRSTTTTTISTTTHRRRTRPQTTTTERPYRRRTRPQTTTTERPYRRRTRPQTTTTTTTRAYRRRTRPQTTTTTTTTESTTPYRRRTRPRTTTTERPPRRRPRPPISTIRGIPVFPETRPHTRPAWITRKTRPETRPETTTRRTRPTTTTTEPTTTTRRTRPVWATRKRIRPTRPNTSYRLDVTESTTRRTRPRTTTTTEPTTTRRQKNRDGVCTEPVGIESGEVPDSAFLSSSKYYFNYASNARLNGNAAWVAKNNKVDEFWQVTLNKKELISGIAIQGTYQFLFGDMFVTSYQILYRTSKDDTEFKLYTDRYGISDIQGSEDPDTISHFDFEQPFYAEVVRIVPLSWNHAIALRVELYAQKRC